MCRIHRYCLFSCVVSVFVHGCAFWALANWAGRQSFESARLGAQSGTIVLESARNRESAQNEAVEFEPLQDDLLEQAERPPLAQEQQVDIERVRENRDLLDELLMGEEARKTSTASTTTLTPSSKMKSDAFALANAPRRDPIRLARTRTVHKPLVTAKAASVASQPSPERDLGVRTGPSFLGNKPPYPELARQNRWEGRVLLRVAIAKDGSVTSVEIIQSSGYQVLDEAAAGAVRGWRGTPAMLDDSPVATVEILPIRFRLP